VLDALVRADPPPYEIIVVDDGSTDNSAAIVHDFPVRLVQLPQNIGAAAAKNRGAEVATGDVLFFTDSDIVVRPDTFARLAADLSAHEWDGMVGLLDEQIPAQNFASQFKNLWMSFTYMRFAGAGAIGLFYTSVAAMRRECFVQAGGFDENYSGASIAEDTEFGQRAWARGIKIQLDPHLFVVHLKAYTVRGVLREDFRRARALTLMRLRKRGQSFFTSVPTFYQLAVPVLYLTLLFLLLTPLHLLWLVPALLGLGLFYLLNASLLAFIRRKRGGRFMFQGALLLPVDVLVVGIGMLAAILDFARGYKY